MPRVELPPVQLIMELTSFSAVPLISTSMQYVPLDELLASSNIISLHAPSLPATYHLINRETIALLRPNTMIINTCRGSLMDMPAVLDGLKAGKIGSLGIDVYEGEEDFFYQVRRNTWIRLFTHRLYVLFSEHFSRAHLLYDQLKSPPKRITSTRC